ncbi:MAG TPA: VanZ family protein [Bryobacteraceae bacterium]|nr:VanZ family protein [Bryobacteraceae bacterium]
MSLPRAIGLLSLTLLTVLALLLPAPYKGKTATFGLMHPAAHIVVFFLLYLCISAGSSTARQSAVVLLFLLAFGAALEFLQTRVYGTPLEYRDISADAAGAMLAFIFHSARRPSSKPE